MIIVHLYRVCLCGNQEKAPNSLFARHFKRAFSLIQNFSHTVGDDYGSPCHLFAGLSYAWSIRIKGCGIQKQCDKQSIVRQTEVTRHNKLVPISVFVCENWKFD